MGTSAPKSTRLREAFKLPERDHSPIGDVGWDAQQLVSWKVSLLQVDWGQGVGFPCGLELEEGSILAPGYPTEY